MPDVACPTIKNVSCAKMMNRTLPEISVCTTTFNSSAYIREAIEGVLAQDVGVEIEYVISDDCSSDETPEILDEYAGKYPDIIRILHQPGNIGLNSNFMTAVRACRGKYIALLDGDDYWIDPHKLQLQYDFLENHPDIVLCSTASLKLYQQSGVYERSHCYLPANTGEVKVFDTAEMYKLEPFWLPTHSLLIRAKSVVFPDWFKDVVYVDRALRLILSLDGGLAFINRITCVYRLHDSNTSSDRHTSPEVCRGYMHTYRNFYHYSGGRFQSDASKAINHSLCEERRRILASCSGTDRVKHLAGNFLSALRHFQILKPRDFAEFVYHFLFIKSLLLYSRSEGHPDAG
ncbi:glycosyltransferase [Parahaliea aestuarii]|nr:glycosyltransferase [Parahaliea aestuarii]